MSGWFFCVVFICGLLNVRGEWVIEDQTCLTPDQEKGTCISLYSCKSIMDILEYLKSQPTLLTASFRNTLTSYHCDTNIKNPKVCCGSNPTKLKQWVRGEICHTPNKEVGTCISIYSCNHITDILDRFRYKPITPSVKNFLTSYHCGVDGNKPKVCCPFKPITTNLLLETDASCHTPNQEEGTCISLYSCKPIMDVLHYYRFRSLTPSMLKTITSYHCDVSGKTPKVCCPPDSIKINQTFIQNDKSTVSESGDVSNHKNLYLLPKECGVIDTNHGYKFPWVALLAYKTYKGPDFKCAATIINERYLLTAAHCVKNQRFPLLGVRIGNSFGKTQIECNYKEDKNYICSPSYQDLAIEEIIPHPEYNTVNHPNDIALLRVASRMNLDYPNMKPVCLPVDTARRYNFTNKNVAVISRWGGPKLRHSSRGLLKVELPIIPLEKCKQIYNSLHKKTRKQYVAEKQLCAGGKTMSDACSGDSGGPLQVEDYLYNKERTVQYGIISLGPTECGKIGIPGVYTRVDYYMDWILDNIRP